MSGVRGGCMEGVTTSNQPFEIDLRAGFARLLGVSTATLGNSIDQLQ